MKSCQAAILIVDDEEGPREALKAILENDYELVVAHDGIQALSLLETHPVDVIISDIRMPRLSGLDLLEKVKAQDVTIEVILLSGCPSDLDHGTPLGVFDCIAKPYDLVTLQEAVRRAVTKRNLSKARSSPQ